MNAINSAIALVKNPVGYMTSDKDRPATVMSIMMNYVVVLAAIPFLATLVGDLWYFGVGYALVSAILTYILYVVAVYVIGVVIQMLAVNFGSTNDQVKSLKLAAYVFTPAFVISVLDIIPFLGFIAIVGLLYGLYILYLGLPIVMGTPKDKVVPYLVAVVVATLIVYVVIYLIIGAISSALFLSTFRYFY
jgi:hypothetical protein